MSELRESALLTLAAQNHADYLLAHPESLAPGQDPHLQSPDSPLFTGLKVQQRVEAVGYEGKSLGENIARRATAESALQSWLETLYSRLPLMDPALEEIGIGEAGSIHERVYVLVAGTMADEAPVELSIRTYPPNGTDEIMADWNGNELPQPKPPPDGYPSGPVISIHTGDTPFDGISGILRNSDGQTVPCTAFSLANDPNLPAGVAAIIPHQPLTPDSPTPFPGTGVSQEPPSIQTILFEPPQAHADQQCMTADMAELATFNRARIPVYGSVHWVKETHACISTIVLKAWAAMV